MGVSYLSVCSGIEAATVAWHPLGWRPVAFAEVDKFPSAVLAHHYPDVPNWGDMTKFQEWPNAAIDVLAGGTPCQSFSVAGLRKGLGDPRGNLMLVYLAIADRYRPEWLVWENVPGVLSSNRGRDFGTLLGGLAELGYGFAYRILDAQYCGVPQRRRRVFAIGHLGDWCRAAAVLFERHSLSGDSPPCRDTRETAPTLPSHRSAGGVLGTDFDCDGGLIAHTLRGEGFDASEDGTGRGTPLVPVVAGTLKANNGSGGWSNSVDHAAAGMMIPVAFALRGRESGAVPEIHGDGDSVGSLRAASGGSSRDYLSTSMAVRRLTPRECERLQGFPDDYTAIPWRGKPADQCPDGPRYKALGNSMAVPVMRWIGERINLVNALTGRVAA